MKIIWSITVFIFLSVTIGVMGQDQAPDQASAESGKKIYEQNCLACHQADGGGVPGLAPPLIKGTFVNGDKERLINIVLEGMEGVEIKGEYYANPMPGFIYLSDQDVADVLTYVRSGFSNKESPVTAKEVAVVRKKK